MALFYDYEALRKHCKALGMSVDERILADADSMFKDMRLSQSDVDRLSIYYASLVKWQFTPRTYTFLQRLTLAFHFLKG